MASNETIQNLATLLSALRGFNQPRREMEMYAKKAMIDFNMQKKLMDLKSAEESASDEAIGLTQAAEYMAQKKLGQTTSPASVQPSIEKVKDVSEITPKEVIERTSYYGMPSATSMSYEKGQRKRISSTIDTLADAVYVGIPMDGGVRDASSTLIGRASTAKGSSQKEELLKDANLYKKQIGQIIESSKWQGKSLLDSSQLSDLNDIEVNINNAIRLLELN